MVTTSKGRPIMVEIAKCTGCLICELRCSLRFEKAFNPTKAQIKIHRLVGGNNEYKITFTDRCDNCGICARYCPYGALIQEEGKEAV